MLTVLLLVLLGASSGATEARREFERGLQLHREGRLAEALEAFEAAHRLYPSPELLFDIGQTAERIGNVGRALEAYAGYLQASPGAPDRETVEAAVRGLEQSLAERGVQQLRVSAFPADAPISVDGRPIGQGRGRVEVPPGLHRVRAELPGRPAAERTVDLAPDRSMDVTLDLSGGRGWLLWPAGIGAAVATGTGVAFGAAAASTRGELLGSVHPQAAAEQLHARARFQMIAANVSFGIGAALAIAGIASFALPGTGDAVVR